MSNFFWFCFSQSINWTEFVILINQNELWLIKITLFSPRRPLSSWTSSSLCTRYPTGSSLDAKPVGFHKRPKILNLKTTTLVWESKYNKGDSQQNNSQQYTNNPKVERRKKCIYKNTRMCNPRDNIALACPTKFLSKHYQITMHQL